eukprot:CFRG1972T1
MSKSKRTSEYTELSDEVNNKNRKNRKYSQEDSDDPLLSRATIDALPLDDATLLRKEKLLADPMKQFALFYDMRAQKKKGLAFMTLSTVGENRRPTARTVVLQGFDGEGFLFYTCSDSVKGQNIAQNPFAALVFWWPSIYLQTRVEGYVKKATKEETSFCCRKYPPNMCAMSKAYKQGTILSDRSMFVERVQKIWLSDPDPDIPAENWTAYKVIPDKIEFWNGTNACLVADKVMYVLQRSLDVPEQPQMNGSHEMQSESTKGASNSEEQRWKMFLVAPP